MYFPACSIDSGKGVDLEGQVLQGVALRVGDVTVDGKWAKAVASYYAYGVNAGAWRVSLVLDGGRWRVDAKELLWMS